MPKGAGTIQALKVSQWLKDWDQVQFSPKEHRRKPEPYFYLFSLQASELRSLCGISRRSTNRMTARAADLGIQREHDQERSDEIGRFVEFGYPWSTLTEAKRNSDEFHDLRKPGWLPTAIVVNIIGKGEMRRGVALAPQDAVQIQDIGNVTTIALPNGKLGDSWRSSSIPPFEVIDGQHRLWSFSESNETDFQLPVVAFNNLDISWQAYLFWTINIKPKRINPSLAFDLYPLLRAEDWLDRAEGHPVYRETRAQELTEAMWSHEKSPWYDRINMLGEKSTTGVTQAAWIRTLMATFVKPWHGRGSRIGGLFGSRLEGDNEVLGWTRAQQAAFLIFAWSAFKQAVINSNDFWAVDLRQTAIKSENATVKAAAEAAFYGNHSLISTDQGVRGFLHVLNDLCFYSASRLELRNWQADRAGSASDANAVSIALTSLGKTKVALYVNALVSSLVSFDWRSSSAPGLPSEERRAKLVFRGGSGYKELRAQLLEHLSRTDSDIGNAAKRVAA
ncbi:MULTISPECIES: DGQHR domain-containing protein [unclassified Mesorhizobium]|uniref:DGQHR domain-containing protein n=1 Tax=unclassified Mesorhizobium TaxID=325217 RepID=UPI001127F01C|nr:MULTISPECIES: DGQHR domain-containing protein [unclassified Mesorhizobium]TPJ50511.1 DGQHR domain-containing protein [Mesorhizobium sp. B2-6-4]TPM90192.1 DGQHR domain-containing protein [Mesorhizobium sp. B2-1-5]